MLGSRSFFRRHGLRLLFLAVTLFALVGIIGQIIELADDGSFAVADLVTVVFGIFLGVATLTQLCSLVSLTPLGRRFDRSGSPGPNQSARPPPIPLHQVSELRFGFASAPDRRRFAGLSAKSARLVSQIAVGGGGLAVVSLIAVLVSSAIQNGFETGLLLGAAFAGLAVYVQFVRVLGQAGWRGSPVQIGRRAFYDSSRIYAGSSLVMKTAFTGAAAVAFGSASLAPLVFPEDPGFDLVGFGGADGTIFRLQPEDGSLSHVSGEGTADVFSPLAVVPRGVPLPSGVVVRRQVVLAVVSNSDVSLLINVDVATGHRTPLGLLERRIDAVGLAVVASLGLLIFESDGAILLIEEEGALWQVGDLDRRIDAAGYDPVIKRVLIVAETELLLLVVDDMTTNSLGKVAGLESAEPCGIARVGRGIIIADRASSAIILINPSTLELVATLGPNPLPTTICGLVAIREVRAQQSLHACYSGAISKKAVR